MEPSRAPVSRSDTSAIEPRYLALLEAERAVWWDPDNFETWKNLYVSEYARGHQVIDTLRKYLPRLRIDGADILDVGCGDAGVPIAFAEAGARAAGIEPHEPSVRRGRVRAEEHGVDVDLRHGIAEELPYPDASFDLVLLDNVLEHVGDRRRTLTEIHRVLRPQGVLYVVTPKPFALHSLWRDPHYDLPGLVLLPRRVQVWYFEKVRGAGAGAYGVGRIPTRWGLRRLLKGAGFEEEVGPRELWIHYLRERIARPEEIRPGVKRRLAGWLAGRRWVFENPALRWLWDVVVGSNIVIAGKRG